jgi:hypothetical protein
MQLGFSPMLGECIILIINIINGNKEPTHGNENCNNNQMLVFGGSLKVREYLYTQITIWVNTSIPFLTILILGPLYIHMEIFA